MKTQGSSTTNATNEDHYDFSGPLWQSYFRQTRNKARFPRGYKEVFSVEHDDSSEAH